MPENDPVDEEEIPIDEVMVKLSQRLQERIEEVINQEEYYVIVFNEDEEYWEGSLSLQQLVEVAAHPAVVFVDLQLGGC